MMMGEKLWLVLAFVGLYTFVCFVKRTGPVHSVSFSCYLHFLCESIFGCVPNNESATLLVFHIYIQMKAAILSKITKTSHSHIEQWTLDGSTTTTTIKKRVIFYIALIKEMALSVYVRESMVFTIKICGCPCRKRDGNNSDQHQNTQEYRAATMKTKQEVKQSSRRKDRKKKKRKFRTTK